MSQRTREIAIRLALGAQRWQLLRFVLRQGLRPLVWGTLLGLLPCVVLALVVLIEVFRDETVPFGDMAFVGAVVAAQMGLALLVCWIPARHAMRSSRCEPIDGFISRKCGPCRMCWRAAQESNQRNQGISPVGSPSADE